MTWRVQAACRTANAELWFPLEGSAEEAVAKRVCSGCPVREACLDDALAAGIDFGVWGGLTGAERRQLRRQDTVVVPA
ncbi:WhiB family transcriptional regulator [Prauserella oleivorans]